MEDTAMYASVWITDTAIFGMPRKCRKSVRNRQGTGHTATLTFCSTSGQEEDGVAEGEYGEGMRSGEPTQHCATQGHRNMSASLLNNTS